MRDKMAGKNKGDKDIFMKAKDSKIFRFSVLMLIVILLVYYISSHTEDFKRLSIVSMPSVAAVFVIFLVLLFTNGLIAKYLLKAFNIDLRFRDYFGLSVISSFYNMITPFMGGSVARAAYLKRIHKFSYINFIAAISATQMMNFIMAGFFGLLSLVIIYFWSGVFDKTMFFMFLAFFVSMTAAIIAFPLINKIFRRKIGFEKFVRLLRGWKIIQKRPDILLKVLIIMLLQFFIGVIDIIMSYNVFGVKIGVLNGIFLYSVGFLSALAAITPGSLGTAELIQVFSALVVGINPAQSLAAALVGRAISFVVLVIMGPLFSYVLLKKLVYK